jgi:hypothetical protein
LSRRRQPRRAAATGGATFVRGSEPLDLLFLLGVLAILLGILAAVVADVRARVAQPRPPPGNAPD